MTRHDRLTALGRKVIRLMNGHSSSSDVGVPQTITRSIPIEHGDERPPTIYTVDLTPTVKGMFFVTCRELPEVMFRCQDEGDGLARAELAIELAIGPRCWSEPVG